MVVVVLIYLTSKILPLVEFVIDALNFVIVCYTDLKHWWYGVVLFLIQEPLFVAWVIYDLLFFFIVIIIVLNLIFGVIIDTFADLRSEKQQKELILKNTCFICGEYNVKSSKCIMLLWPLWLGHYIFGLPSGHNYTGIFLSPAISFFKLIRTLWQFAHFNLSSLCINILIINPLNSSNLRLSGLERLFKWPKTWLPGGQQVRLVE